MKKVLLIFIINSILILAKPELKFEIVEKNNENIKVMIVKGGKQEKNKETTQILVENDTSIYVIKYGDTLSSIAKKFNVSLDSLVRKNRIKNKNLIKVNQKIII